MLRGGGLGTNRRRAVGTLHRDSSATSHERVQIRAGLRANAERARFRGSDAADAVRARPRIDREALGNYLRTQPFSRQLEAGIRPQTSGINFDPRSIPKIAERTVTQLGEVATMMPAGVVLGLGALGRDLTSNLPDTTPGEPLLADQQHRLGRWLGGRGLSSVLDRAEPSIRRAGELLGPYNPAAPLIGRGLRPAAESTGAALGATLVAQPPPKHGSYTLDLAREAAHQTAEDFRHPGERPGYLAADILGAAALGYGTAARGGAALGAAGRASGLGGRSRALVAGLRTGPERQGFLRLPGGEFVDEVMDPETGGIVQVTRQGAPLYVPRLYSGVHWRNDVQRALDRRRQERLDTGEMGSRTQRLLRLPEDPFQHPHPVPETRYQRIANALAKPAQELRQEHQKYLAPRARAGREFRSQGRYEREAELTPANTLTHLIGTGEHPKIDIGLGAAVSVLGDEGWARALADPEAVIADRIARHEQWKELAEGQKQAAELADYRKELRDSIEYETDPAAVEAIKQEIDGITEQLQAMNDGWGSTRYGEPEDHDYQIAAFKQALPYLHRIKEEVAQGLGSREGSIAHQVARMTADLAETRTRRYTSAGVVTPESARFREAGPAELYRGGELTERVPMGGMRPGERWPSDRESARRAEDTLAQLDLLDTEITKLTAKHEKSKQRTRPRTEQEVLTELEVLREDLDELMSGAFGEHKLDKGERLEQMRRNRENAMIAYYETFQALRQAGRTAKEARVIIGRQRLSDEAYTKRMPRMKREEYLAIKRDQGDEAAFEFVGRHSLAGLRKALRRGKQPTVKEQIHGELLGEFEREMQTSDTPMGEEWRRLTTRIAELEKALTTGGNRRRGLPDEGRPGPTEREEFEGVFGPSRAEQQARAAATRVPIEYQVQHKLSPAVARELGVDDAYLRISPDDAEKLAAALEGRATGKGALDRALLKTAEDLRAKAAQARKSGEEMEGYLNQPRSSTFPGEKVEPGPGQTTVEGALKPRPRRLSADEAGELYGRVPVGPDESLGAQLVGLKGVRERLAREFDTRVQQEKGSAAGMEVEKRGIGQDLEPPLEVDRRRDVVTEPMTKERADAAIARVHEQLGVDPRRSPIKGVASSAIPESRYELGGAGHLDENGVIHATHVTDDPTNVKKLLEQRGAIEAGREEGKVGDLGSSGLYVSASPGIWKHRATTRYDWLDKATPEQKRAIAREVSDELLRQASTGYISRGEYEYAIRQVERYMEPQPHYYGGDLDVSLAGQPYNISLEKIADKVGIKRRDDKEYEVPVELRGTFAHVDQQLSDEMLTALRDAGFDGAFMSGSTMAGSPQLVVWNTNAIRKFGGTELNPIEKAPDTFYAGTFQRTQAPASGEYRPREATRKAKPQTSRHDPNAVLRFEGDSIRMGKRMLHIPHQAVELTRKSIRLLGAQATHDQLWEISSKKRTSEWDIPITDRSRWPQDLTDLERTGDRKQPLSAEDVAKLSEAELDAFVAHAHGADLQVKLPNGDLVRLWHEADKERPFSDPRKRVNANVPVGTDLSEQHVRWIDRRLVASYKDAPQVHTVADAINNPLRALYIYGRLAYVMNLPGNITMQAVHQGFAAPEMYRRALELWSKGPSKGYDPKAIETGWALIGEGKARGLTVDSGFAHRGVQTVANWWSSWVDRHSRMSALLYEMKKMGVDLDDPQAFNRFLLSNTHQRTLAARRANQAMVEFNNMTDFEKNTLRHWIFLYPWMSRATVWAFREAVEHPYKFWALQELSQTAVAKAEQEGWWDELPSYLKERGYFLAGGKLLSLQNVNTFSTAAENAILLMSLFQAPKAAYARHAEEALSPAAESLLHILTGESSRGKVDETGSIQATLGSVATSLPQYQTIERLTGRGRESEAGKKPYQRRVFNRTGLGEALGPFSLGTAFPRAYDKDVAAAKAERERRLNMRPVERVRYDTTQERERIEKAARSALGYFDPVWREALAKRAERQIAYAQLAEDRNVPQNAITEQDRLKIDLDLLVKRGVLDQTAAREMLRAQSARDTRAISNFRTNLHRLLGEEPLTGLRRTLRLMGVNVDGS